ncbi:MAG: DUF1302 domain-containing protein [Desulfuromonadales bacterium]|nr:DUF1302 domain-containing protein [Desulfuromonadales bacterium]
MTNTHRLHRCRRRGWLALLLTLCLASPAGAFQFSLGEIDGSLDTTLSYGLSWRTAERDKAIIGLANGGRAYSLNGDDGDLNHDDWETFSRTAKITSDLELRYQDFGLFLRGTAFYDHENEKRSRARTALSDDAKDLVGSDAELLDAYLWWTFGVGDTFGQIRLGDQVLSWGESTFIQNSINTINPVDVSKLRVPGAELKEALKPVGMLSASLSPNEYLTFEGFYQYDWEKTEIDPTGSYWSNNDFAGKGGDRVLLGFGDWSDLGTSWQGLVIPFEITDDRFMMVPRGRDETPSDSGQFGLALRAYAPGLNNTEFGFYYINYHSRLPLISGVTGSQVGAARATTAGVALQTFGANPTPANIAPAIAAGTTTGVLSGLDPATAQSIATGAVNVATTGNAALAGSYVVNEYAQTAQYKIEYPEDIQLFGVSFNTTLESLGASLQGEYSYRKDAPVQVDDVELLLAALSPLAGLNPAFLDNQLGAYGLDSYIRGYLEKDISQVQMTMTKLFGPTIGADQFTLVGEAGLTHVHGMPSKSAMRLEAPGTYVTGNPRQAAPGGSHAGKGAESSSAFADATSWGYRIVGKLDFNNAIGAVTLSPRLAWAHDVDGNSPGPGGNFIEHRKAVTVGLEANYLNSWSADLSYTDFFGAGRYNLLNDRDFLAFNVKYSF